MCLCGEISFVISRLTSLLLGSCDGSLLDSGTASPPCHLSSPSGPLPSPWRGWHQLHCYGLHEGCCCNAMMNIYLLLNSVTNVAPQCCPHTGGADDVHWQLDGRLGRGGEWPSQEDCPQRTQSRGKDIWELLTTFSLLPSFFFCGKDTYLNDVTVENFLTPRERVQPTWCSGSCFPPPSSPCGSATPPPPPWWSLCFATLINNYTYHRCRLFKQSSLNWHLTGFRISFSNIRDNPRTKSCSRFWKHDRILFL